MLFTILLAEWWMKVDVIVLWWKNIFRKNLWRLLSILLNVGCDNDYIDGDVKIRDRHCQTAWKYRGCTHRDCNINVNINLQIPVEFHNLKNYHSHFIMQELGKFSLKINVIPDGLGKVYEL